MECATTALPSRCVLVSGGLDFLGKGPFGAQNFLRLRRACGGSAHRTVAMDPGSETPPGASTPVTSQEVVAIPGPYLETRGVTLSEKLAAAIDNSEISWTFPMNFCVRQ